MIPESFDEENFHEFHGLIATYEVFLHEILGVPHQPIQLIPQKFSSSKVSTAHHGTNRFSGCLETL